MFYYMGLKFSIISDKGGVLAFEPDEAMYKKASNMYRTIKNCKKKALITRILEYRGNQISPSLIKRCQEEEALHQRKPKPKKRKNPLTFWDNQCMGNCITNYDRLSLPKRFDKS